MFSSLMPPRGEFFDLLANHADQVVLGANSTLRLINGLGLGSEDIPVLVAEVNLSERTADQIKSQLITLLHRSFTTPINRDQIHTLTIDLDNVLNALKYVANAVAMYNVQESTAEARELAALSADACLRLSRAVKGLADKKRNPEIKELCREIDRIESQADLVQRKAITQLFQEGGNIWTAMKMRQFYSLQEDVLDCCQDAAKTIEEILIENS